MTLTIAHRGEPVGHVENTLPAIEAALRAGADMVEIDIRLAADGVPVLLHDANLRRIWGVGSSVSALTSTQLAAVRGAGVATLAGAHGFEVRETAHLGSDVYLRLTAPKEGHH